MDGDGFLKQLAINTGLAHKLLVDFIRQEVTRVGLRRAVIALSGGIDSAVVAYLSAEALGAENVMAIRMPYKTSSPGSMEHAGLVIEEPYHDTARSRRWSIHC
jgi:NAD+ synthase